MYIYLFLCLFCVVFGSTNADDSLDSDIEKLPTDVKKQLYERIARRIFNEVKVKKLSNASEVLVTKDQLQEQDAFIKKLLKEEQKKLRRSYAAKNATVEKPIESKDKSDKKNETNKKPDDDKNHLRNENLNSEAKGFIDLTKRSSSLRRNSELQNENSTIYIVTPAKEDNKEETSTDAQQSSAVSDNKNENIQDSTSTNKNSKENIATDTSVSSNSDNAPPDTKEQTMIQIDSLPEAPKHDNEEVTQEFRTKDIDGEHVVKYVNISLLRSGVENQTVKNILEPDVNKTVEMQTKIDSSLEPKADKIANTGTITIESITISKYLSEPTVTTETTTKKEDTTTIDPKTIATKPETITTKPETTTTKPEIIMTKPETITTKPETTTTKQATGTTKPENITETLKNKREEKHFEVGTPIRNNNIETLIYISPQQETDTVQKNDVVKPKVAPVVKPVTLSLEGKTKTTKPTTIDVLSGTEIKGEIKVNNSKLPTTTLTVEVEVRNSSTVTTLSNKEKIYNVATHEIHQTSKKKYENILESGKYINPDSYFVFETAANDTAFNPIAISLPSEPDNKEEPAIVPLHNYEPANAYYNPHNKFAPDSEEKVNEDTSIYEVPKSLINKNELTYKAFDYKIQETDGAYADKRDDVDLINEEPRLVPTYNYDPSNAYYNPSKFFDNESNEKSIVHVSPQEPKYDDKKEFNKKLQNTHISTGNENDIIFQSFNLKLNKQSDSSKSDPNEDNDNYILNYLKKKHKSTKELIQDPPKRKTKPYNDDFDDEFIVIQDIIAQNKKNPKKKTRVKGDRKIKNFVLDTLFNANKKIIEIPKRQKKSNDGLAGLKKFLTKYVKSRMQKRVESSEIFETEVVKTKPSKKQESAFLATALEELFQTPTNYAKDNPQKISNKKRGLRDDIALDYYYERKDVSRSKENYDDSSEKNGNDNLPYWKDDSSKERSLLERKIKTSIATFLASSKDKEQLVTAPKVAALESEENLSVYSSLKTIVQPLNSVEGGENVDESCAIQNDVQVYLGVLHDMIDTNSDALENFDWLGTTVDIEGSLQKLEQLSEKSLKNERLHDKDYQLFKFFVYLHKLSDDRIKSRPKCEQSQEIYRYDQNNNEELIIAPRDLTLKRKKGAAVVDTFKLFNDYFNKLFKINRRTTDILDEYSNIDNLYEFVSALRDYMYELHMAIKNVASITEYSSQNWYRDLKNIFLKPAKRKHLLGVLLHISFTRVLDLVEVAISEGADKNYVQYIYEHVEDFEKIVRKTDFVKAIMQEMSTL